MAQSRRVECGILYLSTSHPRAYSSKFMLNFNLIVVTDRNDEKIIYSFFRIYLIGGEESDSQSPTGSRTVNRVTSYDCDLQVWGSAPSMVLARRWTASIIHNNKIFVIGNLIDKHFESLFTLKKNLVTDFRWNWRPRRNLWKKVEFGWVPWPVRKASKVAALCSYGHCKVNDLTPDFRISIDKLI